MGVYLAAILVGVPGIIFLIYCYTPKGKEWRRMNGLWRKPPPPPRETLSAETAAAQPRRNPFCGSIALEGRQDMIANIR